MFLYHLTLQPPTAIQLAIVGNFSGTKSKSQEILVLRGASTLELLRIDSATGKIKSVARTNTFSAIRSLAPFRLPGDEQDFIVIGNDSGRIVILHYQADLQIFKKVHQETFGRSGCRLTVPGQYVASDPRGRAIMVAALDKQKFIYTMNRDPSTGKLTISSPLEAPKASTLVYHCIALDFGFENPIFACIEVEYGDLDDELAQEFSAKLSPEEIFAKAGIQKVVTFYELDLGLNHTSRKWLQAVPASANHLVAVPGGSDGPGGVLVCAENQVSWHNQGFDPISVEFPKRSAGGTAKGTIVVSSSLVKAKNIFFFLLQTEEGDLFKLSIDYTTEGVEKLRMRLFDTVAVASSLAVLKSGFIFVPAEAGNHLVYQIQSLGDHEDEPEWQSGEGSEPYLPRPLRNLAPIDQIENFAPLTAAKFLNTAKEETLQLYAAQGKGFLSSLSAIRYGLTVTELAQSELPAAPTGIWTLKNSLKNSQDALLILSFAENSTVLSIGESIEEVVDGGFILDVPTLAAFQLSNDAFVQVHPTGVRQISVTRGYSEWKCPSASGILYCAYNERQLAVYLENRSLVYFELDVKGNLSEYKSLSELPEDLTCLCFGPVPEERQRSRFLAVGSSENLVRIISVDPEDCLEPISLQALASKPSSLLLSSRESLHTLSMDVGLENGVLVTLRLDPISGALSDAQTRYIGSRSLKLAPYSVEGQQAVLIMSSQPWLKYELNGTAHITPLFYEPFSLAHSFASDQSSSSAVLCIRNSLRIVSLDNLDSIFARQRWAASATPKKISFHEELSLLALAEADCEGVTPAGLSSISERTQQSPEDMRDANWTLSGPASTWSSAVEIVNPTSGSVISRVQLEADETCMCTSFVQFYENPKEQYVAIGVAKNFLSTPRSADSSSIDLYKLNAKTNSLTLVHKTPVEFIPSTMIAFAGCLLVAVGGSLRLYDIGQKRLLRKCEARFPSFVVSLESQGWRVTVGDAHESIFYVLYRHEENQFVTFADETQPRSVATHCFVDYDTVAVSDRYGNFTVLRLPAAISETIETEGTGLVLKRDGMFESGNSLEKQADFHLADTIMCLQKTAFVHGAREAIFYATISGAIGVFIPFASRNDALLSQNLEMFMRTEDPALLAGRDHLAFRSLYSPVKAVIDGDLCEQFAYLTSDRKQTASQLLDLTPEGIVRSLQAIRSSIGF